MTVMYLSQITNVSIRVYDKFDIGAFFLDRHH